MCESEAEAIAALCFEHYRRLPPRGKPHDSEWTVLAAFVLHAAAGRPEVVSMATGTKCLGRNALHPKGYLVHDAHAEVLARRAFLRYIYEQLRCALLNNDSIFYVTDDGTLALKDGITFTFFSSRSPCGDASICAAMRERTLKRPAEPDAVDSVASKKARSIATEVSGSLAESQIESEPSSSTTRPTASTNDDGCKTFACTGVESDGGSCNGVSFGLDAPNALPADDSTCSCQVPLSTGAKHADPLVTDPLDQGIGSLRTKPGRGDRTLSMSCSDKIAKWAVVGCQGSLLSLFVTEPIVPSSFVVAGRLTCPSACRRALRRGFGEQPIVGCSWSRSSTTPQVLHAAVDFVHECATDTLAAAAAGGIGEKIAESTRTTPASRALIWRRKGSTNIDSVLEVCVDGHREGATKRNQDSLKSRLSICRHELFKQFHELLGLISDQTELSKKLRPLATATYRNAKLAAQHYQAEWQALRSNSFKLWTSKPAEHTDFKLEA